mmetsp:Transcript_77694/g.188196  ORF Transcript_77694/g.188196 Transcript_77694/m.188196 type:complete len:102 (+) Transcript_77694:583-888(+)
MGGRRGANSKEVNTKSKDELERVATTAVTAQSDLGVADAAGNICHVPLRQQVSRRTREPGSRALSRKPPRAGPPPLLQACCTSRTEAAHLGGPSVRACVTL